MITTRIFAFAVALGLGLFAIASGSIYSTAGGSTVDIVNAEGTVVTVNVQYQIAGACLHNGNGNVYICGPGTEGDPEGAGGYVASVNMMGIVTHIVDFEFPCTTIEVDPGLDVLVAAVQGQGLVGISTDGSSITWDIASYPTCLFYNIFVDVLSQMCTCIDSITGDIFFSPYLPDNLDDGGNALGSAGVGAVGCVVTYVSADPCLDIMYDDCTVIHCSYKGPFDSSSCTVLQGPVGNCQGMSGGMYSATTLDLNGLITELMQNINGSVTESNYYYTEVEHTVISNYCSTCGDPLDPCDPEPCLNGGTCSPERLSPNCGRCPPVYSSINYECECPEGFYGSNCEVEALCDNVLLGPSGTFSTPTGGYCWYGHLSGCYPKNLVTCWEIFGTPGQDITITFSSFMVEIIYGSGYSYGGTSTSCSWDYIKVYEAGNNLIFGKYCGFALPPPITSSSGYMRLEFKTDSSVQYPGFSASYTNAGPI